MTLLFKPLKEGLFPGRFFASPVWKEGVIFVRFCFPVDGSRQGGQILSFSDETMAEQCLPATEAKIIVNRGVTRRVVFRI